MPFLRRDSDELEAALALGGGQRGTIGEFADSLRHAYLQPPAPEVAERHLRLMRAAAAPGGTIALDAPGATMPRRRSRPRSLALRLALFVVSLPLLFAGLAAAGVNLPEPAQNVFEGLGIHLPNQDASSPSENTTPPPPVPEGNAGTNPANASACAPACGSTGTNADRGDRPDPINDIGYGRAEATGSDTDSGTGTGDGPDGTTGDGGEPGTAPPSIDDPPGSVDDPALPIDPPDLGLGGDDDKHQSRNQRGPKLPDVRGTLEDALNGLAG